MTVRPDEAAVVRQLVARYLGGESLRSLCTWLGEQEIRNMMGGEWRTGRRTPRRYLLSGLLRCGRGGGKLYASPRENSRRYVCLSGPHHGGCGRLSVVAEPLEQMLAEAVLQRLDSPELDRTLAEGSAGDSSAAALSEALAADQTQLEDLAVMYGKQEITAREWRAAREPIERRMRDRERQLRVSTRTEALLGLPAQGGGELRAQWPALNLTRQAAIVSALLDHAVIAPGERGARPLDPSRVRAVWRV